MFSIKRSSLNQCLFKHWLKHKCLTPLFVPNLIDLPPDRRNTDHKLAILQLLNWKSVSSWCPQVPLGNAKGEGVQQVLPDPKPPEAAAGGVLPARLVLHQRHRHEHGAQGRPDNGGLDGRYTPFSTPKPEEVQKSHNTLVQNTGYFYWVQGKLPTRWSPMKERKIAFILIHSFSLSLNINPAKTKHQIRQSWLGSEFTGSCMQ